MKVLGLLWAILLSAFASTQALAQTQRPLVVAHWLVPMPYAQNENTAGTLKNDIRAAIELGVDGFALDVFSGAQAKTLFRAFASAADAVGAKDFKFFLSADMSLKFSSSDIVSVVETFGRSSHYLQVNGKPLLSTYGGGGLGDGWWEHEVLNPLKLAGMPVTFVPYFDRPNPNADAPSYQVWMSTIERFPSVDGLFNFLIAGGTPFYSSDPNIGRHWWSVLEADEALARALHDSGKLFMTSAMPYYWAVCHSARQYMEFQGGRGMDNMWTSIIAKQHPDIVQLVTWNDYSESTFVQPTRIPNTKTPGIPSMPHLGYYELLKYYISWFHTGMKPVITDDALFFFYRTHRNNAVASDDSSACRTGPIPPSQKWGAIEDVVYVTTALTAPAELIARFGAESLIFNVPAGISTVDVSFLPGVPIFELRRNGKKIAGGTGTEIVEKPRVYNFNLYSGYATTTGSSSDTWMPRDNVNVGVEASWFTPNPRPNPPASVVVEPER